MIKRYLFSAYWRKKDIDFLERFELNRLVKEGFCGFSVDEKTHDIILDYFSKKSFLRKVEPKDFKVQFTGVTFSKRELDDAKYYMLAATGNPKGYPQPEKGKHLKKTFSFDCDNYRTNRKQIASFRIKKPNWTKNQVNFSLNWEWDFMFFKKDFYQEVLAPLGIQSKEVIEHSTGKPLKDTIQLDIPVAKSKTCIEESAYDIYELRCDKKQYTLQTLNFFPPFEKEFDFHICYTQEEFDGGFKRIIISKKFCKLLIKHKIIKYTSGHLTPMKNK